MTLPTLDSCYDRLVVAREFTDVTCLKFLLSKVLSVGIILGAAFVKVPQILKILKSKSTTGLSPLMYLLENLGYLIAVTYNWRSGYAFSTFGESVFLLIQGVVILALFGAFNKRMLPFGLILAPLFGGFGYWMYTLASMEQLAYLQGSTILIFAASKLPQIVTNFLNGSTGLLSVITVTMNVAGNTARIFTTMQEVNDPMVLATQLASFALNGIIFLQVLYYWNSDNKVAQKKTKAASKKAQ